MSNDQHKFAENNRMTQICKMNFMTLKLANAIRRSFKLRLRFEGFAF